MDPSEQLDSDENLQRLSDWLVERLEYCANHKRKNYSEDWEAYDRMVAGAYSNYYDVDDPNESWRSQAYYNICEQKRRSAIAQIDDALTSNSKFPFSLDETPVPDNGESINNELKAMGVDMEKAMEDMELKMNDHLEESKSFIELRLMVDDASKYGVGGFLSPHIYMDKARTIDTTVLEIPEIENENGQITEQGIATRDEWLKNDVIPTMRLTDTERIGIKRIRPSDMFPDPACEGDAQKGFGTFIRQHYSVATLRKMADEVITVEGEAIPKYNSETILKVLKKHHSDVNDGRNSTDTDGATETQRHDIESDDTNFKGIPVYTFFGDVLRIDIDGLVTSPVDGEDDEGDISDYDTVSIICDFTRDGDILRIIENPHPSGKRPFHLWQWEHVDGEWVGKGICQKLRDLNDEFNRFLRYWIDNKILSSSVILAVVTSKLDRNENEDMSLYPGKTFFLREGEDIKKIFQQFNVQDVSGPFLESMYRLMELIDHESGVPRIIEGQGSADAKTAFETQQQEAHALKQLGTVIKNLDQSLVVGLEMIYQYLLIYGDGKGAIIGDFKVNARGYTTFEAKRIKLMEIDRLMQFMGTPLGVHINERKLLTDRLEITGIDPNEYLRPMEEVQQMMAQQAEQAQQQAQMALHVEMQKQQAIAQGKIAIEQAKGQITSQIKSGEAQLEVMENDKNREHDITRDLMKIEHEERRNAQ